MGCIVKAKKQNAGWVTVLGALLAAPAVIGAGGHEKSLSYEAPDHVNETSERRRPCGQRAQKQSSRARVEDVLDISRYTYDVAAMTVSLG